MRFPALLLFFCAWLAAQTAGFSGVAVHSVTGQPLSGVHLKLFTLNVGSGITDAYGAMSGGDGRFSVSGIPPGTYVLFTERTGFVHMMTTTGAVPLPSITLKAGERVTDYRLEMTPRAVIMVRVVDEYGDPVPNVMVEASPAAPGGPTAASLNGGSRTATNTLGEARIGGGPGKFFIKATPGSGASQAPEIRTDGTSDAAYGPTWYPGATSADSASAVEVAAGADAAIEIRLSRQRGVTITGVVSGIPPGSSAIVLLSSGDRPDRIHLSRTAAAGLDGKFAITKLPAAFYRVSAAVTNTSPNLQSQSVDVRPDGPDSVDVQLALTAGSEVTGTLEIAGDPPGAPAEKRTVSLAAQDSVIGSAAGTTEPDGSFKIAGVFPSRYHVDVQPLPENGYVKSVEVDGAAADGQDIDFAHGAQGSRMKITLARDGAQLSGTVLEKDGQPLGTAVAIVILAPDREHISPNQDGMVKEGGKYSFKVVRPGKYFLFAIDAFRSGPSNNEEDFKKLAAAAEEIEIQAGQRITKDLKVLLKEDVDAHSKK